jgi:hypothetical protein
MVEDLAGLLQSHIAKRARVYPFLSGGIDLPATAFGLRKQHRESHCLLALLEIAAFEIDGPAVPALPSRWLLDARGLPAFLSPSNWCWLAFQTRSDHPKNTVTM